MGVFVETELWPNLVRAAADRPVPLLLVSARVSARSTARYLRFAPGLMRETVRAFALIATQGAVDRDRFISLGADPARASICGNLKCDLPLPSDIAGRGAALRQRVAPRRPMWVAGSTHEAEEIACLAAQCSLRAAARSTHRPAPLLVLAPRRPERFDTVAAWLTAQNTIWTRYSVSDDTGKAGLGDATDVLLVDRFGELLNCYAAADVCFVGGTLVPVGGHNLLEPAALGKPVLAGPYSFNAPDSARLLEEAGALRRVRDEADLAQALQQWLDDPSLTARVGQRGAAAVAANRGAATHALQAITALLAPVSPKASPSAGG
jgi:3-deoxy-D-manno-octulosonic-acid transferase